MLTCASNLYWPSHFKILSTIVISKPNKASYDLLKSFQPIILLNTMGKLIKKVIGERLQFQVVNNNFIHYSQLRGLKFKFTFDASIMPTHFICIGWIKNLMTSTLVFDIAQFFPLLNHHLLSAILGEAGFDSKVVSFISNYLVNRKTSYFWNNFSSYLYDINIGVDQGSALSPILSALYLSPFLHILEKRLKTLDFKISILSFVNDSLLISQSKSFYTSNAYLFSSYNIASQLPLKFGLLIEHSKTEVFHFSRSHNNFNSPPLDLSSIGRPSLVPKDTWRYLGFIFNRKLCFYQHIDFYANKAISIVKYMKILSNSTRELNPLQKQLLYISCALPIALYGFQLWFYHKAPLSYPLKILGKLQRRAAIWILGAFKTSPSYSIKAITGLIPIHLHLQKLSGRSQLRAYSLPANHILKLLIGNGSDVPNIPSHPHHHSLSLNSLTKH